MSHPSPARGPSGAARKNVADRFDAYLRTAEGVLSANSLRALKADLALFADWCAGRGLCPLPATAATVAAFVDDMAAARAPATVRRYVASIAVAHRAVGRGEVLKRAAVRNALRRMHRRKGRRCMRRRA